MGFTIYEHTPVTRPIDDGLALGATTPYGRIRIRQAIAVTGAFPSPIRRAAG